MAEVVLTHRMMMLAIQLGIILLAVRLGKIVAERMRLPGVIGEVCAGILIGPYVLGQLSFYGFPKGLFPVCGDFPLSPELYGLAAVAAIVLLFTVGLETDMRLLKRYSLAGALVGVGGVVISFILGDLVAMTFSNLVFGAHLGFFDPACLFLGVISTATSIGITARILSEKRKLDSPEGVTIIAGAVIDDILGIILLAVVLGIITASKTTGRIDWGHIGVIAGKAIGIWLAATAIGLIASKKISLLLKLFRDRSAIALIALGFALILAGVFEHAGLAMIIGAYVMGLSLSQTDITYVIRERISPFYQLLVPVFFCVMGMLIDLRMLFSIPVLIFGVVYTVVAILSKVVGCSFPVLYKFNFRGAMRIGFGMVPRCEIALTIAGIGLARGVISQEVVGASVLMMLVTTLVCPPILVALFKGDAPGVRRPVKTSEGKTASFSLPSREIAELLVTKLLSVFEAEGFFVHLLNREQQFYQFRKDDMIIGFHHTGKDIRFDCREDDMPLVNTAMYEVLAELEKTISGLRKPIDREAIARRIQDEALNGRRKLSLANYLQPGTLEPNLKASTKEAVIDELLGILCRHNLVKDLDKAKHAILTREQSMSTGMQHGIAIPHCRTDAVDHLVCAVGLKRDGIDFGSLDGEVSKIFILTLSPVNAAAPHVQFMSTISQLLNEEGRAQLLACRTEKQMRAVLSGEHPACLSHRNAGNPNIFSLG